MKSRFSSRKIAYASIIAAIYAAVTLAVAPYSFGPVQVRFAEALTVLPFFMPEAIPGLFIGCLLANAGGVALGVTTGLDVIVGPIATLMAALLTRRAQKLWLAPLPPVLVNAVVIGMMLAVTLTPEAVRASFPLFAAEIAAGQAVACYGCGIPLMLALKKTGRLLERDA
ncbi:MAG: QueT transporter family protein [Oscillospiraceae bacterium]|nr:QueT transporter family protein [Oscillospiraceae bacterium]